MGISRLKKQGSGSYLIESEYRDDDGVIHTVHVPVSVTVRDGAGATVFTGTPTLHGGHLDILIPVATFPELDVYTFYWTATLSGSPVAWESQVEIVGGYLFDVADLRDQDRTFTVEKYPSEVLREVRNWVEDVIEGPRAANVAFVPRSSRVTIDGTGGHALLLPDLEIREVYSVTVDGVAWSALEVATLTVDDGVLWIEADSPLSVWPAGRRNIVLHYSHGFDRPPGAITRAGLILAKEYLVKSDVPGRATATSIGDQLFRLTVAGRDGVTGLPDVDAAIDQFGRKSFSIG
jgi:hypothetical protein